MLLGQVGLLPGIGVDVEQFLAVDQSPLVGHHRALAPLDRIAHALRVGDQNPVRPRFLLPPLDERADVHAVEFDALRRRYVAVVNQGRHNIHIGGDHVHIPPLGQAALRPVDEERHAMATIILATFFSTHAVVVNVRATGGAVVGGENENGVVGQAFLLEKRAHRTDVVINVGNHAKKVGNVHTLLHVRRAGFHRRMHRAVRGVGAEVNEERLIIVLDLLDEPLGVVEKHIGAKALHRHGFAVVKIGAVEVGVVPVVGRLPHAATAMAQHFLKTAILRAVRIIVTQMPLAEHGCVIAAIGENPADGHLVVAQHRAAHDGVPHACAIGPVAGNQRRARRRTGRRHVVVGEPHAVRMQLVEVRRLEHRIAMTRQIAIALVIGDHQNHIRPLGGASGNHAE